MSQILDFPNINNCNPTTCVSAKMMKCNRIIANIFRKHLKEYNITDSQLSILFVIAKGKEVNQKKLSDFLYLEKSTVNRNLSRLIKQEYISDEKKSFITLTENGKVFLEKVIPRWRMAMDEIHQILNEDGEEALNTLVSKLTS